MYRRTLIVVYKPLKNNYVLLPDNYFRIASTYENSCLCMTFNSTSHYVSWAPYSSGIQDNEIGINSTAAQAIGLEEGNIVKCSLIGDILSLNTLNVSPVAKEDWDMLEMTTDRIQSTLLDQTKIVNKAQKLIVWINRSMFVTLKIDKLEPDCHFGKIQNNTELIVAPFQGKLIPKREINGFIDKKEITNKSVLSRSKTLHNVPNINESKVMRSNTSLLVNSKLKITEKDKCLHQRQTQYEDLLNNLKNEQLVTHEYRVITEKWDKCQISDLYITKHNLPIDVNLNDIYLLTTADNKEFYIKINIIDSDSDYYDKFPCNKYNTIQINNILMKLLNIKQSEYIKLQTVKRMPNNYIERIEIIPNIKVSYKRDIEQLFKQYIIDNSKYKQILLNNNEILKINNELMLTIKLHPNSTKYILIDCNSIRKYRIVCNEDGKNLDYLLNNNNNNDDTTTNDELINDNYVDIEKFQCIFNETVERLKLNLCLNDKNLFYNMDNILLMGPQNSGKTTLTYKMLDLLSKSPYYCYYDIIYCSRNKGRKPESIQRDFRQIFTTCLSYSPSILLLDNLDVLAQHTVEQTADGEYFNRISYVISNLIEEFTKTTPITIIATINNINNLNKQIYTSRGKHLFQNFINLPELELNDREYLIKIMLEKVKLKGKNINKINWKKLATLSEGYTIGYLAQFIERAIFYAYRNDPTSPEIDENCLYDSIKTTNSYCLQGIENQNNDGNNIIDDVDASEFKISGLDTALDVLEEVLLWPSQYPLIFNNSPLRNQAGVLLFGPPGTGKTFLISKISKLWNLRLMIVKGPELLAKYIGQSEENVRNLFNKARSAKPCVIFFDEFDSLAPRRGHDSTGVTDRVVNQLLTELDGVEGLKGVIVVAATSRPDLLDPALLRSGRIDRLVECQLPDKESRKKIFENLSKSLILDKAVDFDFFSKIMNNYTGADIQSILTSANMIAVQECIAKYNEKDIPDSITITQEHLLEAFNNTRPSLTQSDIQKYKLIYSRFTNKEKQPGQDFVAKRTTLA